MKFSLMLRKTHEAELDRAINIITEKNRVIAVKKDELKAEQKIKEVLTKRIEELQYKKAKWLRSLAPAVIFIEKEEYVPSFFFGNIKLKVYFY